VMVSDPDARVTIDDESTKQKGMERLFISPVIKPGEEYHYTVRATWTKDGEHVTKERTVAVRAGYVTVINFRDPQSEEVRPRSLDEYSNESSPTNVAPMSDQDPLKDAGPPGSNDPRSLGVGNG